MEYDINLTVKRCNLAAVDRYRTVTCFIEEEEDGGRGIRKGNPVSHEVVDRG